jgi:hypothetical protein
MTTNTNALAIVDDGFNDTDPTQSPIRGPSRKFKDGYYVEFADKIDVKGKTYAVLDRVQGWQKLERDTPPAYVMRMPGQPRPPQPVVPKEDWPLNLNGKPQNPWRWTSFLHLLDVVTGEISTFSTNTIGGNIAIGQLSDQVAFMRRAKPGAIPIVALGSRLMPTQYGGEKPRPAPAMDGAPLRA